MAEDFYLLVARMRFYQQQYIRTRAAFSLEQAKKYEQKVDKHLTSLEPLTETLTINIKLKK